MTLQISLSPSGYEIRDSRGLWIATVMGSHGGDEPWPTDEEALENARLIVEALSKQ